MTWLAILACVLQICSDDPVLGNERVAFDPPAQGSPAEWYEAVGDGASQACNSVAAPATEITVAGTLCVVPNETAYIRVRGCSRIGGCGPLSDPVEFMPWACLRGNPDCEEPCYPGAPRRFPLIPRC